ncbi:helix-turn-helix transcriptional regulator [Flavobacterium sp. MAH-1]|uniref:Helix-turn-helix transcriptional regulator n=1 Tax=Flavobacterium agri TaxID=2743471 RepID=A0A7Y9C7K2_9FLAO|nr:metalloregulator ArsR/SmtB family transcription factor [Flavobacterium agri]NUY81499.1 helix-turn-helix transcriptional regulator [Flavobacterium agri]NYA71523.1 helix-turn-helix transcriptional regulator [Flavobacterium agri]
MKLKQVVEIGKCLSNQTRVEILEWLKNPEANFPPNESGISNKEGVCVGNIQEKTGLSQSTISTYLGSMERCGLLHMVRNGKWSYFSRNEETIQEFIRSIQ